MLKSQADEKKDYKVWKGMSGGERHGGREDDVRNDSVSDVSEEGGEEEGGWGSL